ncbi:MAG: PKD domain-containing protein, partial [Dehalococcoidia bacterium]|nr:PKD domain-containing protein [Dehalococcoidia bacterium]
GATSCVAGGVIDSCSPGTPAAKDATCDGVDDDCDGTEDEDYPPLPTSCGVGACGAAGAMSCVAGTEVDSCTPGTPAAADATCDAIDDDCDGTDDEDYAPTATSCGVGACSASGATACSAGAVVDSCSPGIPAANDATCDAIDDDCDGAEDEDYASLATGCGIGACSAVGATSCAGGAVIDSCSPGAPAASDATCDSIDDDCDGVDDEDYLSLPTACGIGECAASGATSCVAGGVVDSCDPGAPTSDANCDALDQDCDGASDEDYLSTPTACGVGACAAAGALVCSAGAVVDTCAPGTPAPSDAVCDAVDEDCDGATDEDFSPYCAADATVTCVAGAEATTECADADVCNGAETCSAGACVAGTPITVDDGNPCTDDSCDPLTGVAHDPTAVGTSCDDADVCNGEDLCDGAGVCEPGLPPELDDGNPCTDDTCDPLTGVAHDPSGAGLSCDDGDPCNGLETCDGAGMCIPGVRPLEGPCVPAPPTAGIFVDERREVMTSTVGGAVLSYDGFNAPTLNANGLFWNPSTAADGMADVYIDLAGTTPQVISEYRVGASGAADARFFELWTSSTTMAPGDFTLAFSGEVTELGDQTFTFPPVGARFVRVRVLESLAGVAGAGRIQSATIWTRDRDGGAISLYEAGVPVAASAGSHPEYGTDFSTTTLWDTFGSGAPIAGQTLTVDLPGTAYHVVDRVRLWGGNGPWQVRNFEVLASATTDDPAAFSVVATAELPRPDPARNFWFFFPPTRARYVRLRTIDNYGGAGATQLGGFTVFTAHEGGLTVPFEDRSAQGGEPIVAWRWDFGDGTVSHERHPTHTFPAPGTYVVSLRVIDAYGLNSTDEYVYSAYGPPVADFTADPIPSSQGQSVSVRDTSYAMGAPLVEVGFTPNGDALGTTVTGVRVPRSPGGVVAWTPNYGGTLAGTVDAIDATLLRDEITRELTIDNIPPTIDFGEDQTVVWGQPWRPVYPATLHDATPLDSPTCSYDFDDGPIVPGPTPCLVASFYVEHSWAVPGTYVVRAIATDHVGAEGEDLFTVEVTPRDAAIALSPVPGAAAGGLQDVTAQIIDAYDAATPIAGRTIELRLGAQVATAVTDASGRATVPLNFTAGVPAQVTATFAGDAYYYPARGEASFPESLRPSYPGNCGTDYWIAIPNPCGDSGECPSGGGDPAFRYSLFFSAEASTAVRVDMPGHGQTAYAYVDSTGVGTFDLPLDVPARGAVRATSTILDDAIHITSERIVCVHELSYVRQGTDGFLALPTNSLGTDYVVGTAAGFVWPGFTRYVSQFVVVGTQDATDVTITQPSISRLARMWDRRSNPRVSPSRSDSTRAGRPAARRRQHPRQAR